jgi:hypothetical protein
MGCIPRKLNQWGLRMKQIILAAALTLTATAAQAQLYGTGSN